MRSLTQPKIKSTRQQTQDKANTGYLPSSIFSPNTRYFLSYLGPIVSRLDALDLRFLKSSEKENDKLDINCID